MYVQLSHERVLLSPGFTGPDPPIWSWVKFMPAVRSRTKKIVMVGAGGAGKSTIASRLVTGTFVNRTMTIGLDIESWALVDEEGQVSARAAIFDLGGQEHFRFFQERFVSGASIVLIVFDITRFKTIIDIDEWIPIIEGLPRQKWILVGNKTDEGRVIPTEEIESKAKELGIPFVLVSAKTGENFDKLADMVQRLLRSA